MLWCFYSCIGHTELIDPVIAMIQMRHGSFSNTYHGSRQPLIHAMYWLVFIIAFLCEPCFAKDVIALKSRDLAPYQEAIDGFKSSVRARVKTVSMHTDKDYDEAGLIQSLKDQNFDLIYALGSEALHLAVSRFPEVPVIFSFVLESGAIIEQAGRGHHRAIRGISMNIPPEQQLRTLVRIAPQVKKVGVVYDRSKSEDLVLRARVASRQHGLTLIEKTISKKQDAIDAFTALQGQVDCILMLPDVTVITAETVKYLLLFSFRANIPLIGISEKYVTQGALFALSSDIPDLGKQAGDLATQVLSGKESTERTLSDPASLTLSINAKTAAKFGITLSDEALKSAERVY